MELTAPNDTRIRSLGSYETYEEFVLALACTLKKEWNQRDSSIAPDQIMEHRRYEPFDIWKAEREEWVRLESILLGEQSRVN